MKLARKLYHQAFELWLILTAARGAQLAAAADASAHPVYHAKSAMISSSIHMTSRFITVMSMPPDEMMHGTLLKPLTRQAFAFWLTLMNASQFHLGTAT